MKMVVAIIPDTDHENVSEQLISNGFRVTTIASTGGFLRYGTTTMMIGVEDEQVERAIEIVKESCAPSPSPGLKRGSLFVLDVERYEKM
jgi:uncharacterized protein YaaQ